MRYLTLFTFLFVAVSSINAQEMTMFSSFGGYQYYIDEKPITNDEAKSLMADYPEAKFEWDKSRKALTTAYVFLGAEVGFGIWMLSKGSNTETFEDVAVPYAGFMACAIGSIVYSLKANKHKKNSVLLYNRRTTASYQFTPSNKGLGLVMHF